MSWQPPGCSPPSSGPSGSERPQGWGLHGGGWGCVCVRVSTDAAFFLCFWLFFFFFLAALEQEFSCRLAQKELINSNTIL